MQLVGKMLAIALESPGDPSLTPSKIMFFDVSNPEAPVFKSQYTPINGAGQARASAGTVAITPLPGGRYLMMTTGAKNSTWYFYRSRLTNPINTDLSSPYLSWDYVGSIPGPSNIEDAHQTIQFLRQGNIDGPLFLAGARGHPIWGDRDRIDLYEVICETKDCVPGEQIQLPVIVNSQGIYAQPNTGGTRLANLAAASTFHVTPSGELLFYATEHDNDGPDGTVKAGEWRHTDMARGGSPLYLPTALVNGPYEVYEGQGVWVSGAARPPILKAWIELFHGIDFNSFSAVVDFDDYSLDDFDNFFKLEYQYQTKFSHDNKARSLKWWAPDGCSIRTVNVGPVGFGDRILPGTGQVQTLENLSQSHPDLNEKVDAVQFRSDCSNYYATPFELWWDLDVNGYFETTGNVAFFNAAYIDGPVDVNVPAQARHPFGGPTAQTSAKVTVRNANPRITQLRLIDSTGRHLSAHTLPDFVPSVLTNLHLTVEANFTDAGVLDRQTASINWGDGVVEAHPAFTSFVDAFGGATGALSHAHRYSTAGLRKITISVRDDDGGFGTELTSVNVITPEQAIEAVIARLNAVIPSTSNDSVRQHLEQARQALAGSGGRSNDGALQMIMAGNIDAAIGLLKQSIASLQEAQAGGVNVRGEISLLEQAAASLNAG
jgi:hypothetical protein